MIKYTFSILVHTALNSLSHQPILSQSLKHCSQQAISSCVITPEIIEAPHYCNTTLKRQNVCNDRSGAQFRFQVAVMNANTGLPITNAAVTLWDSDALKTYSHYIQANQTFLRDNQLTNANGIATFDTIHPGSYFDRATHMHIKILLDGTYINTSSYYLDATNTHTGQLFSNNANNTDTTTDDYTSRNIQNMNFANDISSGLIKSVTLSITSPIAVSTLTKTGTSSIEGTSTTTTHHPDSNRPSESHPGFL